MRILSNHKQVEPPQATLGGEPPAESAGMSRLEAFSDGVFAVAITLLALQFTVPAKNSPLPADGLAGAVFSDGGRYISYILSFLIIGIIWVNHHITFRYIRRMNRKLLSLNILFLMCVSFIPYPTALLGAYIGDSQQQYFAAEFYSGVMFITSAVFYLIWIYGVRNGRLVGADVDMALVRAHSGRGLLAPGLYLLSFIVAFFNVWISLGIYALIAILFIVPLETDRF